MDFKELIKKNKTNVKNIIKLITKQENEDLEQEVYIRAWKNAERYKEQGSFKSWINTIAKNISKDYLKSAQKKQELNSTSDELILNRLEKTIKHANSFVKEHPKFDKEEVAQDLIEVMIRAARDYKGEEGGNFNRYAFAKETEYLISLLK